MSTQSAPYQNATKLSSRQKRTGIKIATGMTQTDAYQSVYNCTRATAERESSRLMTQNPLMKPYVDSLIRQHECASLAIMAKEIMSPKERQVRLTEIARARLVEFQDEAGTPTLTKDTPNNAAAKEYYHKQRVDRDGNPVISKSIKLTDPIEAIRELNKMDGSYAPSKHLIAQKVKFEVRMVEKPRREEE